MIAHFGMYPFAHLRDAFDQLWAAIAARLDDAPATLDRDVELHESWHRPDLLLGHTCGWPLVTALDGVVAVVGRFDMDVPFAHGGDYRSVIVASKPLGREEWRARPDTVFAVNNDDSLSGWVSLQSWWGAVPSDPLFTGAHVESMHAVAARRADVAAIDGVTFEYLCESEPMVAGSVHVIGHGPVIPCLPIITSLAYRHRVEELRTAVAGAVSDPAAAGALSRLRIRGFVACGAEAYEHLRGLPPPS